MRYLARCVNYNIRPPVLISRQPHDPKHTFIVAIVLLVWALSLPFWWLGSASRWQLLPGVPVSALKFVCPCLAATVLTYRDGGANATGLILATMAIFVVLIWGPRRLRRYRHT